MPGLPIQVKDSSLCSLKDIFILTTTTFGTFDLKLWISVKLFMYVVENEFIDHFETSCMLLIVYTLLH